MLFQISPCTPRGMFDMLPCIFVTFHQFYSYNKRILQPLVQTFLLLAVRTVTSLTQRKDTARRLAGDEPNCGNRYDVIEMCAPAAPPIMLRIRTRSLNPNPN